MKILQKKISFKIGLLVFLLSFFFFSQMIVRSEENTWVGPTATAPQNNVAAPLNTSSIAQHKLGALTVGSIFGFNYLETPSIACESATEGYIRFNVTSKKLQLCNGTAWIEISSGEGGSGSATFLGLADTVAGFIPNALSYVNSSADALSQSANLTYNGTNLTVDNGGISTDSLVVDGGMAVDTSTLYVDQVNNRVGVGTTNPLAKLDINNGDNSYGTILARADEESFALYTKTLSSDLAYTEVFRLGLKYNNLEDNGFLSFYRGGSGMGGWLSLGTKGIERLTIKGDGNVGIGNTNPGARLDIVGNESHTTGNLSGNNAILRLYNNLEEDVVGKGSTITFEDNYYGADVYHRTTRAGIKGGTNSAGNTANGFLAFYTDQGGANSMSEHMRIDHNGNVGIGTTSPSSGLKLDVAGKIGATEYCDADGNNCIAAASLGGGGGGGGTTFLTLTDTPASFTTNALSYVNGTGDALTQSANLTYNGTNLTVDNGGISTDSLVVDGGMAVDTDTLYINTNKIGIGTIHPTVKLHVNSLDDDTYALRVQGNTNNSSGTWTGIGIAGESNNTKAGILFEDIGVSYSRGKLHFALNNETNQNNATLADSKMVITNTGNVGIGITNPIAKLAVNGNILLGNSSDQNGYYLGFRGRNDMGIRSSGYSTSLESPDNVSINIDTNNNNDDIRYFSVRKNDSDYNGGEELFRVQENGNVGVGTNHPDSLLSVYSSSAATPGLGQFKIGRSTYENFEFAVTDTDGYLIYKQDADSDHDHDFIFDIVTDSASTDHEYHFDIKGNRKVSIQESGNVGIGTTSPSSGLKLDVAGKIGATEYCDADGNNCTAAASLGGSGGSTTLAGLTDTPGTACTNGQILIYNTTSSAWECADRAGTSSFVGSGTVSPCKQILDAGDSSGDGVYSFDPDGAGAEAAYDVYCDMTTDGGGWTFLGHVNSNSATTDLFITVKDTYQTSRIDNGTLYSLGKLDEWADTEMYITLDTTDVLTADGNNKLIYYRYAATNTSFNNGPTPCSGSEDFEYKLSAGDSYISGGKFSYCGRSNWYNNDVSNNPLVYYYKTGSYGTYWGAGLGGDNSWYHDSWIYVR